MHPQEELEILIRAKYPILYIVSWEERRVEEAISKVCTTLNRTVHTWSVTQGAASAARASGPANPPSLPGELEVLAQVHEAPEYTVFISRTSTRT